MKKAQLKKLRELIQTLPRIPLLYKGKPMGQYQGWKLGADIIKDAEDKKEKPPTQSDGKPLDPKLYYKVNGGEILYVNKEKYFIQCDKQGMTAQQAVDSWNEKHKKVLETIAATPNHLDQGVEQEEMKQSVADEEEERQSRLGLL